MKNLLLEELEGCFRFLENSRQYLRVSLQACTSDGVCVCACSFVELELMLDISRMERRRAKWGTHYAYEFEFAYE